MTALWAWLMAGDRLVVAAFGPCFIGLFALVLAAVVRDAREVDRYFRRGLAPGAARTPRAGLDRTGRPGRPSRPWEPPVGLGGGFTSAPSCDLMGS